MSHPQPPYPQQPQWGPPAPTPPSRGTAVAAGVLALVAGLFGAGDLIRFLVSVREYLGGVFQQPTFLVSIALQVLAVILLLIGGIMLFARAGAGRFLVVAGAVCVLGLVAWSIISIGVAVLDLSALAVPLFAVLASVLALLPSTGQWIAAKKQPPHGFPPPPPGYHQPGYPPPGYQQPGAQQPGYGPPRQW
ncbi:hypothetical protein [Lentzea sp. NBRC 105346]|uniref:hypothetical protein n=1 Tax=Lentzea sp. NBRC 105346 TaxID=3032205 RepID=UPI00255252FF|nr:hypothetical protein [Lentzea sp. NBRC 105346]